MRALFLFILLSVSITVLSQKDFKVIDFKLLPRDYSAASHNKPPKDNNGEPVALIKIVTTEKGFTFELGSALAPIGAAQEKMGEIWLYVPNGTRKLIIKHNDFGVIRYPLEIAIKGGKTYELRLKTPNVTNKDLLGIGKVKITTYPDNAVLYNYANIEYKKEFSNVGGKNQFFVKLDTYVTLDTVINIKPDQLNEFTFKLVKNWVDIEIKTNFEDANVFIDEGLKGFGEIVQKGFTDGLAPGKHNIKITKDKHYTIDKTVFFKPGATPKLNFELKPIQGTLKVQSNPKGSYVYIDNDKIGNTPISKVLLIGDYTLTVKKKGFVEVTKSIKIEENTSTIIDMSLVNYSKAMRPLKIGKATFFTLFAVALIGGVGTQLYANSQMTKYNDTDSGSEAQMLKQSVNQFDKLAIIGFSSAAVVAVPFAIFSGKIKKMKKKYGI